ncbi:MAG TPA: diaminopimelate epimerase [Methylophilaceae bacterium]|nr:diaminopimelate epimerase [Methylophilaceae bacterium]
MKLHFTKMHGIGNDFIVLDHTKSPFQLSQDIIQSLSHRQLGIGFDQLLVVEKTTLKDVDFKYRIFNQDGNEVEQCGNGARCFYRFVKDKHLTDKKSIRVETKSGVIELSEDHEHMIEVNMGEPIFNPKLIPFISDIEKNEYTISIDLPDQKELINIASLSMGNPHAVITVKDVNKAQVKTIGAYLESHALFPKRVNVGFMEIVTPHHIRLRVFERGVGETLACGTGACAAAVSGIKRHLLTTPVKVDMTGGSLSIDWKGDKNPVMMKGPAVTLFEGDIEIA